MDQLAENRARVQEVLEALQKLHRRERIRIKASKSEGLSLDDSKFGGLPLIPVGGELPLTEDGQRLALLAQISCARLPANSLLPAQGYLQFWFLPDDTYGVDLDDLASGRFSRVLYLPAGDFEPLERVEELYPAFDDSEFGMPFQDAEGHIWGMALTFERDEQGITFSSEAFGELFVQEWQRRFPDQPLESFDDLPYDWGEGLIWDTPEEQAPQHQLGGYPTFTQYDPRTGELAVFDSLLFQIDSQFEQGEFLLCWGDMGICNFFLPTDALGELNFSRVLYTYDCG